MDTALYAHIPFCRRRCNYCDFNTWAGLERLIHPYVAALISELNFLHEPWPNWRPDTFYLGGGTPSLLPAELLHPIILAARPRPGAEISLEANPGTLDSAALLALRRMGINRLSLGVQSARADELSLLGRLHDFPAVTDAVRWARTAGFDNINLDLIYGLPAQKTEHWQQTLDAALALSPEHLSLYALTIEPGTPLARQLDQGQLPAPDPDHAADLYEIARDQLAAAGYQQYEISNWARPGRQCRHNLAYWRNAPYLGVGAGAWGHWPAEHAGWRLRNTAHPQAYIEGLRAGLLPEKAPAGLPLSPACVEWEFIPRPLAMAETIFMGLRLLQKGLSRSAFQARFGSDPVQLYADTLADLAQKRLIRWDDQRIYLPPEAVLISNQVFVSFLPE